MIVLEIDNIEKPNYYKNQNKSEFIHTENFILVDHNGHIRGVYNGTIEFDVERLKRHISILKREYDLLGKKIISEKHYSKEKHCYNLLLEFLQKSTTRFYTRLCSDLKK